MNKKVDEESFNMVKVDIKNIKTVIKITSVLFGSAIVLTAIIALI